MADDIPYSSLTNKKETPSTITSPRSSASSTSPRSSASPRSSTSSISSINSDIECNICYSKFGEHNKIELPCCKKKVCSTCVFDWHVTKRGTNCMFCRGVVVDINPTRISNIENRITIISNDYDNELDNRSQRNYCINCMVLLFAGFILFTIHIYNHHIKNNSFPNTTYLYI